MIIDYKLVSVKIKHELNWTSLINTEVEFELLAVF